MKIYGFLAMLLFTVNMMAQSEYKASNEGWLVDVNVAYEQSSKTGKPIMANFTGSDWCGWCKKLKASVFDTPEFKTWAAKNVILLELDFPRQKQIPQEIRQQNQSMQQALQVRGYPTVWVFYLQKDAATNNMQINTLGQTGYAPSPTEFISKVEAFLPKK